MEAAIETAERAIVVEVMTVLVKVVAVKITVTVGRCSRSSGIGGQDHRKTTAAKVMPY